MRVTLVRHAETPGNVNGVLDTAVPGPGLTDRGVQQALALVERFAGRDIDALYASVHVRTQFTAEPLATDRNLVVEVRPGLREFSAGDLEGRSDPAAIAAFVEVMRHWMLGDLDRPMPGGESGTQVVHRMDEVLAEIADSGARHPVVFSHGGALRIWAASRAANITTEFALANYLVNTAVIVMTGGPREGWHCESWDLAPGQLS